MLTGEAGLGQIFRRCTAANGDTEIGYACLVRQTPVSRGDGSGQLVGERGPSDQTTYRITDGVQRGGICAGVLQQPADRSHQVVGVEHRPVGRRSDRETVRYTDPDAG